MKKRLFVYSVDALVEEDLAILRTKPNFREFLSHCCGAESIRTIYPSITYPVHVSIQTGCYPDRHGVYCNNLFSTDDDPVGWTWDSRLIRSDNIFAAAKRSGYSTAAAFWPVTAYNPAIDYHLPEYWLAYPGDTLRDTFMKMGASEEVERLMEESAYLLPKTYARTGKHNFTSEPQFDDFMIHVACGIIRKFQPELMMIHGSLIDTYRHQNGIFGPVINRGLDQIDAWFGMLLDAMRASGVYEQTNIVVLSDHGQRDLVRVVKPNVYLADRGLIRLNDRGEVEDYTAFGISNGMSMTFWLKDPNNRADWEKTHRVLEELAQEGVYGFNRVFTREETEKKEHLSGDFAFIVESDGYTSFAGGCTRPVVSHFDLRDYRMGRATHGYLPDEGPQPVFLAKGPDFRRDVMIPRRPIVDEAPTFAKLLGVSLKDAQGTAMDELLC